jgi:acyl-CoA synthetase (AMP-forming)/AMP-acid ligase II
MTFTGVGLDHPARRATFGDQLRRNASRYPERAAIVAYGGPNGEGRRVVTYRELNGRANRLASALASRGVSSGDVVAIMGRNCPESFVAFWAAAKLGAAVTGINYTFTAREMAYQLQHSGAQAVVVEDAFVAALDAISEPLPHLRLRVVIDAYADTAPATWLRLSTLIAEGEEAEPAVDFDESIIGIIPYTSGTEALPKAVAIPQRNYFTAMIPSYVTGIGLVEEDVWFYTSPFHTIAGMGMQIALVTLANTLVLPFKVEATAALEAIQRERVTIVGQTPTFFLQLIGVSDFAMADLSTLRRCITYGGTMPRAMFEAFAQAAPQLEWVTLWSQSEITQTPTIGRFRSLEDVPGGDPSWIGRPTAALEVRVVDSDGNDAVRGELVCRTPGVMAGYYKNPERTEEVLRDGWLHTGDLVRIDSDGNLYFEDRVKDMIKSGGMNVSSVEIERIIYQHPAVLEVAVVGLADEYWSQAVTAFVVPRSGAKLELDDLIAFCRQQLAPYKVPKAVHVVEALPKDTQGKILKRELRAASAAQRAAEVPAA